MGRSEIIQKLRSYKANNAGVYGIQSMGIFGSCARDTMTSQSDVDIVVDIKEPDFFVLVEIKTDVEELLNCKVDVVRMREDMNGLLKNRILQEVVYV